MNEFGGKERLNGKIILDLTGTTPNKAAALKVPKIKGPNSIKKDSS